MTGGPPRSRRSLRTQLLIAFVVPLVLVLTLVGVVSVTALRSELVGQVDSQLATAIDRSLASDRGPRDGDGRGGPEGLDARGQSEDTLVANVTDGVVTRSGVLGERGETLQLTDAQEAVLADLPVDGGPVTRDLGGELDEYRLAAVIAGNGEVLVNGLPLGGASDAVRNLVTVELLAGLAALLAAAGTAVLVIRRTLAPLDRVAATATRVSELPLASGEVQLAERVAPQDTDPGTEVGQVGTALNRMLDHVEGSLAARQESETRVRQFVADASHELRTPLASIRGYAELVRRQHTEVAGDVGHAMNRVESEALRMSALVEELLLLARLDAGRELATEEVDLTALVVDAVSDAHVAGRDHRWQLDLPDTPVLVRGDAARLHQVLVNLLGNARTHTPEGTTVTTLLRTEGDAAVLQVVDDGPGVPAALQDHVFERFARGDASRSRSAGSTGLGLAIVHAVAAAHGGSVELASTPGRTAFTVRLPHATQAG
ncbi:HAMP domain-containing sensor histidine kinase [Modestobacter sp. VKM Ac-2979]|uniref:sensor histidine kinase n=1 Tax=unclassified Modestobacter TaxID=2643866 RepID=UPI0022AB8FBC|nr:MULTISPECIES: HAMP domain-containing sensor histidine kinase [unclassified Modestobacter]MCZ2811379.1 HAMP domain-containing sensor histidine kinase [Modestobacter sp. VKM Ac-2979]MCZ2840892.1 HAMP domain-containing sensor histidine kinase [Modestobacter sp. VKM Ac-2980]